MQDFVTSTFSVDSGNVPDSESLAFQDTESSQVMQMSKSRSVPHELRGQQEFRRREFFFTPVLFDFIYFWFI